MILFGGLSLTTPALASTTDGTIDATNRYAWSENAGWIDFGTTEGSVHVTDSALTGYAWGENVGWISLNCSNNDSCGTADYKVTNDGEGTLGGYAWSENLGWIQFAPTNGGVTIDASGGFGGYAWGENVGWIAFNCSTTDSCGTVDYRLSTDWRPVSARATSSSSSSSSPASAPAGVSAAGGGRGSATQMAARVAQARVTILARFDGKRQERDVPANAEQHDTEESAQEDREAEEREVRIAERIGEREAEIARIAQTKAEFEQKYALHREERMAQALALEEKNLAEAQAALLAEQEALKREQEENREKRAQRLAERERLDEEASRRSSASLAADPALIAARRGLLFALVGEIPILFSDVSLDAWYAPYVSYVVEEKIATGYADEQGKPKGEFGVANPITYAEVLKMALEAAGQTLDGAPPRNTSAQGSWASPYVAKAEEMQLSVFPPDRDVQKAATRGAVIETVLEVLGVTIGHTPASYDDVPKDHPYTNAIAAATFFGLVQGDLDAEGKPLNRFRPDDRINRAEVAKIIALAKEVLR